MIFTSNSDVKAYKVSSTKVKRDGALEHRGLPVGSLINFGSGMSSPYNKLSNFNECVVTMRLFVAVGWGEYALKEFTFLSSEHARWAHFFVRNCDIKRLAVGGDLSTLETGLPLLLEGDKLNKALKYWAMKNNVGIVHKLLAGMVATIGGGQGSWGCR